MVTAPVMNQFLVGRSLVTTVVLLEGITTGYVVGGEAAIPPTKLDARIS